MHNPQVSIIITTKNEEEVIERLLKSIRQQTYKNKEVLIVDNHSTDKTLTIARKYTNKIFIGGPERSAQRNIGASKAMGDCLFFLDADMELSVGVISECVKAITSSQKIGSVTVPEQSVAKKFWEKVKAHERSFYNREGDSTTDAARFFTRQAFYSVGGYDESITGPEDWDLPENIKKNGFWTKRIKSFIFHYERIPSPWQLARKKYYYALTSHRYLKKHNISPLSAKTIYFLRPVFYRQWKHLISHPVLSVAMYSMFFVELSGGGLGFIIGKIKKL